MKKGTTILLGFVVVVVVVAAWLLWQRELVEPEELTPVTVRLKWLHQAQFAGMYMAQEKGFYQKAGLDVTFLEPDFEGPGPIVEVTEGAVDFAVVNPFQLLTSVGAGVEITAVAAIFQDSPLAFASLAELGVTSPADFRGRTVGLPGGTEINRLATNTLLEIEGIDPSEAIHVPVGLNNIENVVQQKADILPLYRTSDPYVLDQQGVEYNLLYPERYGSSLYDDILITSNRLIETNPDLVRSFVRATLRGWEYALAHPDEAVLVSLERSTAPQYQDQAYQKFILEQGAPLIKPTGGAPIGSMSFVRWQRLYRAMETAGLLEQEFNAQDAYTTDFLP